MDETKSTGTSRAPQKKRSSQSIFLWRSLVTGFCAVLIFLVASLLNWVLSAFWPQLANVLPFLLVLARLQPGWLRVLVWCGLLLLLLAFLVFIVRIWRQKKAFERDDAERIKLEQRQLLHGEVAQPLTNLTTQVTMLSAQVASTQQLVESNQQRLTEAVSPPVLLTPPEFAQRMASSILAPHDEAFIGRDSLQEQVKAFLSSECCLLVLHGPGGIGKTRLLLSLPEIAPPEVCLWFVRTEGESIEQELMRLDPNRHHVIVVDDAHRFVSLVHLREVLVNPALTGKVKLILSTRSVFKETAVYPLGTLSANQITTLEVSQLTNADIDRLLQQSPALVTDVTTRHTLVRLAEGNPLIARIGTRLFQEKGILSALTRNQVLTHYLDELLHDLESAAGIQAASSIRFLEVLAALGIIDLSNKDLREQVQLVIGVSPTELDRIVSRLLKAGLVEQYWHTLKITSDVLADHLLVSHFFDPETRQADYQRCIIEPFFALKPKEILTHLAEAEVKGESTEAGLLLGGKLTELAYLIKTEGNWVRLYVLSLLQDFAFLRPDDILAVVMEVVDGEEHPSESRQDRLWGTYEIGHEQVLEKAADLLGQIIYRGDWQATITYLYKLATYRPGESRYASVRKKAGNILAALAKLTPRKPYALIKLLLDAAIRWGEQGLEDNLDLILAVIQPMLSIEIEQITPDPTKPLTIVIQRGAISQDVDLQHIRQHALEGLFGLFHQSDTLQQHLKIVQALTGALAPINAQGQIPTELRAWLHSEGLSIITFFSEVVIPKGELPVIDRVAEALWRAKRFAGFSPSEVAIVQHQIQSHRLYQLYRLLVGGTHWVNERDELDWREGEQARQKAIEDYVAHLTLLSMDGVIQDLAAIAEQARLAQSYNLYWLNVMLVQLGERHPGLAHQMIERTLTENGSLKHHLTFVLAGLRRSDPDKAWTYIRAWSNRDDFLLLFAVAHSFSFIEVWSGLSEQDWEILRQLVEKGSASLNLEVLGLIPKFASLKSALAAEFLKEIATHADERTLRDVATHLPHVLLQG